MLSKVGKTTLMVKYVENKFDEDYIQTLGTLSNLIHNDFTTFINH
jgi:GTPase SAR1 family protein